VADKKKKRKPGAAAASAAAKPVDNAPAAVEKEAVVEEAAVEKHEKKAAAPAKAAPSDEPIGAEDLFGLMGWFSTPGDLYHACEALRDAGYTDFDAHTPFPVHGLEKAMGLRPTKFPIMVFIAGLCGLAGAIALAYYTQAVWYPQNISGKLPFSYQAYIPIFFELTVLLAGLTCFFGLWAWLKLPTFFHPTFQHPSFHRHSDDLFFISVEAKDPKFDREKTKAMLEKLGIHELQEVRQ
jgi:hypothetical protein